MRKFWFLLAVVGVVALRPAYGDMVSAIEKVKPSVVMVGTYKTTRSPRFGLRGAGFVVGDGNLLITNAHVLPQSGETDVDAALVIQVGSLDRGYQVRSAKTVALDLVHDLALLRFDGAALAPLILGNSDEVREGQLVAFTGFPIGGALGYSPVTHRGMVSSIAPVALPSPSASVLNARLIKSLRQESFDIFQLDGTAYPGNSGGPLFSPDSGEVLGVVNMVFIKGTRESALTHPSGISYAIPAKFVQQLMQSR